MDPRKEFELDRARRIAAYGSDESLSLLSSKWLAESMKKSYVYNFDWMGRPIIQFPQDIVAVQELIWEVKPDLIIETGIAHGGSLILSASMLALLDMCEAIEQGVSFDPRQSSRKVLGLDIDIRAHNKVAIESHPMSSRIQMLEGSSIDPKMVDEVKDISSRHSKVMVFLDSNHTHEHVLAELEAYASLTSVGSYCVVFDTFVEDMVKDFFPDRPWNPGNNPKTAVREYLKSHQEFEIDSDLHNKLQVTVAPDGFLKRTS